MKKEIHPEMHPVVFVDTSCGAEFVTMSTLKSEETRDIDGVSHFVINLEISSKSHPFFTGEHRFVDTAGRVDKFKEKMERVKAVEGRKGKKAKRAARAAKKAGDDDATPAPKAVKKEEAPVAEVKEEAPAAEVAPAPEVAAEDAK